MACIYLHYINLHGNKMVDNGEYVCSNLKCYPIFHTVFAIYFAMFPQQHDQVIGFLNYITTYFHTDTRLFDNKTLKDTSKNDQFCITAGYIGWLSATNMCTGDRNVWLLWHSVCEHRKGL